MEHSQIIKKLRQERNLTQAQLSDQITQRSTLSSFENNSSRVTFENLVLYLERMNITLEEYQFLIDNKSFSNKRELAQRYYDDMSREEMNPQIREELLKIYSKTGDFYYYSLYAVHYLVSIYESNENLKAPQCLEIKKNIINYLNRIETWGHFELSIFTNLLFCFDEEYIRICFKQVIKKMKQYQDSLYYSKDLSGFLINGIRISYEQKSLKNYKLFKKELFNYYLKTGDLLCKIISQISSTS